jgi:hypothetical protein
MAKSQKRSNREIKKPKQKKVAAIAATPFAKGVLSSEPTAKKKG